MDNNHKTELKYIVAMQKSSDISQDQQIAILADILVEGFIQQVNRNKEEPKEELPKKTLKNPPTEFYLY